MKVLTIRLPDTLWNTLREQAFKTDTRYNTLCLRALEAYLTRPNVETEDSEERREDQC